MTARRGGGTSVFGESILVTTLLTQPIFLEGRIVVWQNVFHQMDRNVQLFKTLLQSPIGFCLILEVLPENDMKLDTRILCPKQVSRLTYNR
jgi:hypothetical protein